MSDDIVPWWVVWSEEHGGWWAAPSGYTTSLSLERAARYTEKRALEIEANANRYLPKDDHDRLSRDRDARSAVDVEPSPRMKHVWICQCLCPDRHCIMAAANEAESEKDARRIRTELRRKAIEWLKSGALNNWCGLCGAGIATWRYELRRTRFATMAEAMPHLRQISTGRPSPIEGGAMTDDVVAKLDRYLENDKMMGDMIVGSGLGPALATEIRRQTEMIRRARDEIVALREMREAHIRMLSASLDEDEENMRRWIRKARDDALRDALPAEPPDWWVEWWNMTGMHGPKDCYRALRAKLLGGKLP